VALSEGLLADPLGRRRIQLREARAGHGLSKSGPRSVLIVLREKGFAVWIERTLFSTLFLGG
jgi:hypothetical protein